MHIQINGNICSGKGVLLSGLRDCYERLLLDLTEKDECKIRVSSGKIKYFYKLPTIKFGYDKISTDNCGSRFDTEMSIIEQRRNLIDTYYEEDFDIILTENGVSTSLLYSALWYKFGHISYEEKLNLEDKVVYESSPYKPCCIIHMHSSTSGCFERHTLKIDNMFQPDMAMNVKYLEYLEKELLIFSHSWQNQGNQSICVPSSTILDPCITCNGPTMKMKVFYENLLYQIIKLREKNHIHKKIN